MINIGVICDTTWDNFILMNNKFKKINSELYRIHALYCKTLEIVNNCCQKNNLTLIRNYSDSLTKTIYNMLKTCSVWLIFTNQIEYNTPPQLIISICDKYNINYIIISEYSRNIDYYSFEIDNELSFKKILSKINISNYTNIDNIDILNNQDYKDYNDIFIKKSVISLLIKQEIRDKLRCTYSEIEQSKKDRYIKLLYDKDEFKKEKQVKKTLKKINQMTFSLNRRNYYKNNTNTIN